MADKRVIGRKGRKPSPNPLVRLNARVYQDRLPEYEAHAAASGLSWSDWVRAALDHFCTCKRKPRK